MVMFNMKETPVSVTYALLSPDPSHLVCNVLQTPTYAINLAARPATYVSLPIMTMHLMNHVLF